MDSVLEDAYDEASAETRGARVGTGNGNGKSWGREDRIRVSGRYCSTAISQKSGWRKRRNHTHLVQWV
jgi:hypothetical protein